MRCASASRTAWAKLGVVEVWCLMSSRSVAYTPATFTAEPGRPASRHRGHRCADLSARLSNPDWNPRGAPPLSVRTPSSPTRSIRNGGVVRGRAASHLDREGSSAGQPTVDQHMVGDHAMTRRRRAADFQVRVLDGREGPQS